VIGKQYIGGAEDHRREAPEKFAAAQPKPVRQEPVKERRVVKFVLGSGKGGEAHARDDEAVGFVQPEALGVKEREAEGPGEQRKREERGAVGVGGSG
jgi:hypothetical protein